MTWPTLSLTAAGVAVLDCDHRTPAAALTGHPYIAIPEIRGGVVHVAESRRITPDDLRDWTRRTKPQIGDIVVTRRARVGDSAPIPVDDAAIGQNLVILRSNGELVDQGFLRWAVRSPAWWDEVDRWRNVGAVFTSLNVKDIAKIAIPVPDPSSQRAIAEVLGALDDKIAANDGVRIAAKNAISQRLALEVSRSSRVIRLGEVAEFHNRKRIPLSSRERSDRPGAVPYWGANGVVGYVDEALFDERLVLVGEDGSVRTDDGHPVVHYVWGPAWVNNHAHVLTGRGVTTELLRYLLAAADVTHLVTGAVQPKLSMGNLRQLELRIPVAGLADQEGLCVLLQERIVAAAEESRHLATLRDTLLPHLMSGRITVRDAEKAVENA